MARFCTEVCSTSGSRPASLSSSPPRTASFSPFSVRFTSTQPVNRFFAFHSLSPWRRRISLYGASAMRPSLLRVVRRRYRGHRLWPPRTWVERRDSCLRRGMAPHPNPRSSRPSLRASVRSRRRPTSLEAHRRREPHRHHHRVVRLLPLRLRRRARLQQAVLPRLRPARRHAAVVPHLRRRLRRPAARRAGLRPLRRPDRPQEAAGPQPAADGRGDLRDRAAAHARDRRHGRRPCC